MIADAAYFLAQQGSSGCPNAADDWYSAEAEFEAAFLRNCVLREEEGEKTFWSRVRLKLSDLIEKAGRPYADTTTIDEYLWH
jgi:hypothetical protein